jgi:hypothetical protein
VSLLHAIQPRHIIIFSAILHFLPCRYRATLARLI